MELLSKDDLFIIGINLDLKDLLNFCKTSKHINNILCKRDNIWLYNINKYFPTLDIMVMNPYRGDRSWKQYYIEDLYPTLKDNPNEVLRISTVTGRLDLVTVALYLGSPIDRMYDQHYALGSASYYGHLEVVKLLIDYGANIKIDNNRAVRYASMMGHYDVVKLLIENDADIYAKDNAAVKYASQNGHYETVKLLIDSGADIHAENNYAVRYASENGHYETVKLLIDSGADIHEDDNAPVILASKRDHFDVVKLLISHGAPDPKIDFIIR